MLKLSQAVDVTMHHAPCTSLAPALHQLDRSFRKGREAIVNQTTVGTVSKATLGKGLRDGVQRIWAFPSAYRVTVFN